MSKNIGTVEHKGEKIIITIDAPKNIGGKVEDITVYSPANEHEMERIKKMEEKVYKLFELIQTGFFTHGTHSIEIKKNHQIIIKVGVVL